MECCEFEHDEFQRRQIGEIKQHRNRKQNTGDRIQETEYRRSDSVKEKHTEIIVERPPWDTGGSARDDPYTRLAVAIVMKAVEDYIAILKTFLKGNLTDTEIHEYKLEKRRLEQFFHSKYYDLYTAFLTTEIDPELLIKQCGIRAKERLEEDRKKEEAKKAAEKVENKGKKSAKKQATKKAVKQAVKKAARKRQKARKHNETEKIP